MSEKEGIVIAITGGFCSGKTTVAKYIEEKGYKVIYTDDFSKELMEELQELKDELISAFGKDTYNEDGSLNKKYLKEKVFCSSGKCKKNLDKLNKIVHPYVLVEREKLIEEYIEQGASHVFVESALIYEAGIEEFFDYVIAIYAPEELVIQRAKERGFAENDIHYRLENQMSPKKKKALADFAVENKGSIDDLKSSVDFIIGILT